MGRGARPEPWFVLALLTFSMTTFWSLIYLYFDVFGACVTCSRGSVGRFGPLAGVAGLFAAAAGVRSDDVHGCNPGLLMQSTSEQRRPPG